MDESEDFVANLEINIRNKNEEGQIVLNDLLLLELLYTYPYLYSKQVRPQQDVDYDKWGWEQIASQFNTSYEDLVLSAPFSVEELQWRWDTLRPLMATLAKHGKKLPYGLHSIIQKIYHMLRVEKPHNLKPATKIENFILDQLPFVEALSDLQRRRLEVEIIDTILQTEMKIKVPGFLQAATRENEVVQNEYDIFLKDIRVKELPTDTLTRVPVSGSGIFIPAFKPSSSTSSTVSSNAAKTNQNDSNSQISNICSGTPSSSDEPTPEPSVQHDHTPLPSPPHCIIKIEPADIMDNLPQTSPPKPDLSKTADPTFVRFVPIKSAKYYSKKVRVLVKRTNLEEYVPLAKFRKRK